MMILLVVEIMVELFRRYVYRQLALQCSFWPVYFAVYNKPPGKLFSFNFFLRVHGNAKKGPATVAEKTIPDLDLWDLWITGLGLWLTEFASSAFKS
jgi:hypothetical protein